MQVAATPNISTTCTGGAGAVSAAAGAASGAHINNIPAGALQTSMGNNATPANATLTMSNLGYISGRVFKDNNVTPNGAYDSGVDAPLSGVSIELHSGATCAGALVSTATTDALGNYLFSELAAGAYSVCQPAQPSGTSNGITTAGNIVTNSGSAGTAGVASNPSSSSSQIANIVLGAAGGGQVSGSPNNNFAEVAGGEISGTVFLDQNNNGVQNGADNGLGSVTLELLNSSGTVVATTTTNASGQYSFTNLQPGVYSVREPSQPTGSSNGVTTAGAVGNGGVAGTATAVSVLPSQISNITLPPGTVSTGNNFAEIPNGRTVSGKVFYDANNNGVQDSGETGAANVTLNLTGNDINGNAVSRTVNTSADGSYMFSGVPEGSSYSITEPTQPPSSKNGQTLAGSTGGTATLPAVAPSAISGINLAGGNTVSANNNFAEIPVPSWGSGSAVVDGVAREPQVSGRQLSWPNLTVGSGQSRQIKLILLVGSGVGEGEYSNQAWAANSSQQLISNVAAATVRIVPDPTFDCSDIIGKVFDDQNANGYQDDGEPGIPNVRVVTARGLLVTTDADGRFHVPCAAVPQADRGSNFVMKLDERTLPSGYRLTTENPRDVRATRGKLVKLNFGAAIHKVFRLEFDERAFVLGEDRLQAELRRLYGQPR